MMLFVFRLASVALLFPLLLLSSACSAETHPLAHLSGELSFTARIPNGEEGIVAEVWLGKASGDGRNAAMTVLSPASLAGVCFRRQDGTFTVSLGAHELRLDTSEGTPLAYLDLLLIRMPLSHVRQGNGEKVYLFSDGDCEHTLAVRNGALLPYRITLSETGSVRTLEILP